MPRTLEDLKIAREDAIADHRRRREQLGLREDEPFDDDAYEAQIEAIDAEIAQLGG